MNSSDLLWIELPPAAKGGAKRLMVFVHSGVTSTEEFLPVAIHWQLKFPSAVSAVLHDPVSANQNVKGWVSSVHLDDPIELNAACHELQKRIRSAQMALGFGPELTTLIGHGVGASLILETLRRYRNLAQFTTCFGGRIAAGVKSNEKLDSRIHLIHGQLDTLIPVAHAQRALRGLSAIGTKVTLDIVPEANQWIDQDMINLGTSQMMKALFEGRRPPK